MKTLGQFSPMAAPLAVAVSLFLATGNLRAFGPGGGGNGGAANGVGTVGGAGVGTVLAGGSHGGVVTGTHGGTVTTGGGSHTVAVPTNSGVRSGVAFSNNSIRANTSTFSPASVSRVSAPASYNQGTQAASAQHAVLPQTISRPRNAWSGPVTSQGAPALTNTSRSPVRSNAAADNRTPGQHLYPGTYGSNLPANDRGNHGNHSNHRFHFPYRYYYNTYGVGPYYAPFISYYGGYYGAYPYANDGLSTDADIAPNNTATTVSPQYVDQGQEAANPQPNPPQTAPQNGNNTPTVQGTIPNNGPDSLVEAVQDELIRRGYFAGKVDAMFNQETKDALRKFQADHHLAETGLINEATLHALQLD